MGVNIIFFKLPTKLPVLIEHQDTGFKSRKQEMDLQPTQNKNKSYDFPQVQV